MRNILFVLIICGIGCVSKKEVEQPDLLLKNAKIWTGNKDNPWVNWLAIKDGNIVQLGQNIDEIPLSDETIDLNGRLLLPGFNDSHVHFAQAGGLLLGINLLDVSDDRLFIERVKETTERLPPGSWITRGDWGAYEAWALGSQGGDTKKRGFEPTRSLIDDITPNHPVLVTRFDRQVGMANAIALKELGIDSPTGILRGTELEEALKNIPEKSFERKIAEAKRALYECRKWGVTTVQDMSPLDQVDVYRTLQSSGDLTCRINFSPSRLSEYAKMIDKGWVIDWDNPKGPSPFGDEWITFGTLKTHIDGIMGARSARFYEPYSDNSMETPSWRGGWREFSADLPNFKDMLVKADKGGIQLRIHAIGDEANAILLNILDTLDSVNGKKDRRFRLVHAQVIAPEDFSLFNGRSVVAEVQPYHVTDDMRWMEERIGHDRCKGAYAFKTLQENGCLLSFGSDWPGTNASYYPINPLYGLYAAVTRQTLNGEPAEGWFPEQRISLEEALKAYTWGSSYGAFEENRKGTIEIGKFADLTVLDTDLFDSKPQEWLKANVDYTIVAGKIVYSRKDDSND